MTNLARKSKIEKQAEAVPIDKPTKKPKADYHRFKRIDWEYQFERWRCSGLSILQYLRAEGILGQTELLTGTVYRRTIDWTDRVNDNSKEPKEIARAIVEKKIQNANLVLGLEQPVRLDSALRDDDKPKTIAEVAEQASQNTANPNANQQATDNGNWNPESTWDTIIAFRKRQALSDHKTAEAVRSHIRLLLNHGIANDQGRPRTKLKPYEIRALALALKDVQQIQRLSLGMSTENIGIDDMRDTSSVRIETEKNVTPEPAKQVDETPTFEVQMSRRGRFITARPRRVS